MCRRNRHRILCDLAVHKNWIRRFVSSPCNSCTKQASIFYGLNFWRCSIRWKRVCGSTISDAKLLTDRCELTCILDKYNYTAIIISWSSRTTCSSFVGDNPESSDISNKFAQQDSLPRTWKRFCISTTQGWTDFRLRVWSILSALSIGHRQHID